MDLSVLDRQRAVLQCLHQPQNDSWQYQDNDHLNLHYVDHHQQLLSHCWNPVKPDYHSLNATDLKAFLGPETASTLMETDIQRRATTTKPERQCNSSLANREGKISCSIKKRKAEFDIEEEDKEKGIDAEEAGEEKSEITTKTDRETSTNTCSKESSKVSEVQKPDYIHVRARRGQATDSHSLAERARREKISKKMKCLQELVPGCNKVTGKAGMLDEIINYVQSLQKQVEFLSMKLANLNPRLDFTIDNLLAKEIPAYIASFEATNSTCFQYNTTQQQGISNCVADIAMDQSQMLPQKAGTSSVPIPEVFLDSSCIPQLQQLSGWESGWPSLFNAGFH